MEQNMNAPLEVLQGESLEYSQDDPWAYTKGEGKTKGMKKKRFRQGKDGNMIMDFYGNRIDEEDEE